VRRPKEPLLFQKLRAAKVSIEAGAKQAQEQGARAFLQDKLGTLMPEINAQQIVGGNLRELLEDGELQDSIKGGLHKKLGTLLDEDSARQVKDTARQVEDTARQVVQGLQSVKTQIDQEFLPDGGQLREKLRDGLGTFIPEERAQQVVDGLQAVKTRGAAQLREFGEDLLQQGGGRALREKLRKGLSDGIKEQRWTMKGAAEFVKIGVKARQKTKELLEEEKSKRSERNTRNINSPNDGEEGGGESGEGEENEDELVTQLIEQMSTARLQGKEAWGQVIGSLRELKEATKEAARVTVQGQKEHALAMTREAAEAVASRREGDGTVTDASYTITITLIHHTPYTIHYTHTLFTVHYTHTL
jgi:hypothetical protein